MPPFGSPGTSWVGLVAETEIPVRGQADVDRAVAVAKRACRDGSSGGLPSRFGFDPVRLGCRGGHPVVAGLSTSASGARQSGCPALTRMMDERGRRTSPLDCRHVCGGSATRVGPTRQFRTVVETSTSDRIWRSTPRQVCDRPTPSGVKRRRLRRLRDGIGHGRISGRGVVAHLPLPKRHRGVSEKLPCGPSIVL